MSAHGKLEVNAAKPIMDVAILYEDWGTGVRAKHACEQVAEQAPAPVAFSLDLWRFDLLEEEALRAEALRATADSDLLIVSAHGHRGLPTALQAWLQDWLVQRLSGPTGLVISLDATAKGSSAANQILAAWSELAQSAQVDLFLHFGHAPQRESLAQFLNRPAPARGRPQPEHGPRP